MPTHHCHVVITITNGHLHPHPAPTISTARLMWQHHVTSHARHIDNTNEEGKSCHIADCDVATTRQMMHHCRSWFFVFLHHGKCFILPLSHPTSLTSPPPHHHNTTPPPPWCVHNAVATTTMMDNLTDNKHNNKDGWQTWRWRKMVNSDICRCSLSSFIPFPHHFSDTHSSYYVANGDIWQLDDERRQICCSLSFLIYFTILSVHSLYLN